MILKVYDIQGGEIGDMTVDDAWQERVNRKVVTQAVAMHRMNLRQATSSSKTRGEVSGGGKKPYKQKHTGRARAGSSRSPLWRGGAVIFGPRPHTTGYRLPQALRRRALVESLKSKLQDQTLVVVDGLRAEEPKTKPFAKLAKAFSVEKKSVIILRDANEALVKSLQNLDKFSLRDAENLNAYDVVNAQKVLISKEAFAQLEDRVKKNDATSN